MLTIDEVIEKGMTISPDRIEHEVSRLKELIKRSVGYDTYYMHVHTGSIDTKDCWLCDLDEDEFELQVEEGGLIEVEFNFNTMQWDVVPR